MVFLEDHLWLGDLRQESILDIQATDGDRLLDIDIRQGEEDTRLRGPGIRLIAFIPHQDGIRQLETPGKILDPGVILIFSINLTGCVLFLVVNTLRNRKTTESNTSGYLLLLQIKNL